MIQAAIVSDGSAVSMQLILTAEGFQAFCNVLDLLILDIADISHQIGNLHQKELEPHP